MNWGQGDIIPSVTNSILNFAWRYCLFRRTTDVDLERSTKPSRGLRIRPHKITQRKKTEIPSVRVVMWSVMGTGTLENRVGTDWKTAGPEHFWMVSLLWPFQESPV